MKTHTLVLLALLMALLVACTRSPAATPPPTGSAIALDIAPLHAELGFIVQGYLGDHGFDEHLPGQHIQPVEHGLDETVVVWNGLDDQCIANGVGGDLDFSPQGA